MDVGKYMTVQTEQKTQRVEIGTDHFANMKREAKEEGISDLELSREVVRQADLSQGQEMVARQLAPWLERVQNITYGAQYLRVAPDGTPEVMNKDACLREVQQAEQEEKRVSLRKTVERISSISSNSTPDNGYGTITSENGYMQLGLWVAELNGTAKKGDFLIVGVCGWIKTPLTRKVDAISLAIDDFTWDKIIENDNEDAFSLTFQSKLKWADNIAMTNSHEEMIEQVAHEKAAQVGTNGIYFSWDLPNDSHSMQCSCEYRDMVFIISGTGCLRYPSLSQDFSVHLKYAHLQYALTNSVSFGWSSGNLPGVTLAVNLESQAKYYTFHVPFHGYTP